MLLLAFSEIWFPGYYQYNMILLNSNFSFGKLYMHSFMDLFSVERSDQSAKLKINVLISQLNHMFWVLK